MTAEARFVRENTALMAPPLVPEVRLHLATEVVPLWRQTEEELQAEGIPPPYWAFAWAGGQALARYVLDHPTEVAEHSVLDFGSGSGLVAIAAVKAGAHKVVAADIDAFAIAAIKLNAAANGVALTTTSEDLIGREGTWDAVLLGDMCYERPLAERLLEWLRARGVGWRCVGGRRAPPAGGGQGVHGGSPGRSYFPKSGVEKLATYRVQ